ncbi:pyridoxamine 5'-phosphate oxidase family protein [Streptomyces sp. 5-8]|uniref:Pyridoxamine 5'-phosphate oxidase family protein n=1 Tax=Streptomyces musisoli TaxID=2802280 RepID=A0ABS1P910_9ACTN|nr:MULTISPECIES: pyridoxamine 5'-phosphate oxidase family protein [Streptomyces]MBL1108871.1 pyridoxamine 5'-phosphate oxidase family protein [Streptomyces musisoli]MBY8842999.1 pyridoxamine 5'-phosphate oxidase family protein [Streptomyces sp. SP2-10]
MMNTGIVERPTAQRVRDTLERLGTERDVWVSTAHPEHGPHQVPLWFLWDGRAVWMCTGGTSVTARNVHTEPRVRLALPDTFDVVLLQGDAEGFPAHEVSADAAQAFADKFGWDPRAEEGSFLYIRVVPRMVRAWRGGRELAGRVVMRDGTWLT